MTSTEWFVGLDVGTTSCKAAVTDADGTVIAVGSTPTPWQSTVHGIELDAVRLLDQVRSALAAAVAIASRDGQVPGRVLGLGATSMAESGVYLDAAGTPTAPVIAWHDTRDVEAFDLLSARLGGQFSERTGLPLRQQWSLTKHRWLLDHDPGVHRSVRRLNVAEYVVHALGGEPVSEQSLASRTGWLDLATRSWWPEALEVSGARTELLAPLAVSGDAIGVAHDGWAVPGLAGAVLTVAGHDHQAAAVGTAAAGDGDELDSCGTAEAFVRTVPPGLSGEQVRQLTDAGITVGWHALAGRWCLLGATQGGLLMRRVLGLLGVGTDGLTALDDAALAVDPGSLFVFGAADGEALISGIGDEASPAALWRASVEAAASAGRDVHELMSAAAGPHRRLVVSGGWTRSRAVLEVRRRMLGDLQVADVTEAGCRGAALFAALAAGVFSDPAQFPAPHNSGRECGPGSGTHPGVTSQESA